MISKPCDILKNLFEKYTLPFDVGDTVYLRNDIDQLPRFVTGIWIRQAGISYALTCADRESWHYDFEISKDKDILKSTTN